MGPQTARQILSLLSVTTALFLFSSCSDVEFGEKPTPQCNNSQLTCSSAIENGRKINIYDYNYTVPNPKADILFVVDNSLSMAPEQLKLATALNNFATALSGIDWQIGITTTDMTSTGMGGKLVDISTSRGNVKLLTSQIPDYENAFYSSVSGQGESGSNDERGILSALRVIESGSSSGLLRAKSHLAVIVLSDEDERSVGGIATGYGLVNEELPRYYVDRVNSIMSGQSHSFYSVIIRPSDQTCLTAQGAWPNQYSGYEGKKYFELQNLIAQELYGKTLDPLTSPEVGNICDSSYYGLMSNIGSTIKSRVEPITLPCDPIDGEVSISPTANFSLQGRQIVITPAPTPGQVFHLYYKCYAN